MFTLIAGLISGVGLGFLWIILIFLVAALMGLLITNPIAGIIVIVIIGFLWEKYVEEPTRKEKELEAAQREEKREE